jgi:uncharacterized Zn finger protein
LHGQEALARWLALRAHAQGASDLALRAAQVIEYPEWAIKQCKMPAERTMNNGDAKHYANAVEWLRRARTIYAQHDRLAEWQRYLRGLLDVHSRKYKLVPMLKEIW